MRFYTVHVRHSGLDPDRDIRLVKEGFSWPAFFLGLLWAFYGRLWLAALALVAAVAALEGFAVATGLDPLTGFVLSIGIAAAFGWLGNDLIRRRLDRDGFAQMGVVAADDREAALKRFLDGNPALAGDLALTIRA
ncbi:MAG: DUF2628 domain-containing protein [Alphaproteobacteria bacterium]|nr:DUF2628 domain-containing protein [Alphaproteobacteria bacterium]